jgi:hypothetical protein
VVGGHLKSHNFFYEGSKFQKIVTPKQKEGMILGGYPLEIIKLKTPHIVRHGKAIGHNLYRNRAYTRQTQMEIPI